MAAGTRTNQPSPAADHAAPAAVATAFLPVDDQLALILRGAEKCYTEPDLRAKLEKSRATGKPLRVKLGLDPTSPDIHIGHTVVLRKLGQFQQLGHQAVLIIGDATAMVGDPTGKSKTRPVLTADQVTAAAQTYLEQVDSVLDVQRLEVRRNSEWLHKMGFMDVVKLCATSTVARMLERDDFAKRFRDQKPISIHEFLYPLMQARDSVEIAADVELGGTDQTFNLLMGRNMLADAGQPAQVCLTTPLLVGLDGVEKMSKSLGNSIGVRDTPDDQYGKTMSIPDAAMQMWFELATHVPAAEIAALCDPAKTQPRDAKDRLAREIVASFHGRAAAYAASAEFTRRFREHHLPDEIPGHTPSARSIGVLDLLVESGLAASKGEARRLVQQGGVKLVSPGGDPAGEPVAAVDAMIDAAPGVVVRSGKRKYVKMQ